MRISVFGVGRLGLCFCLVLEKAGYEVLGVELLESYANEINEKTVSSAEPFVDEYLKESKNFRVTTSQEEAVEFGDVIFLFVATPSTGGGKFYDHSAVSSILEQINNLKVKNKHIVIGCTILPGYMRNNGKYLIRDCENTTLSYNPEFIAQGQIVEGLLSPDIVLIGEGTKEAGDVLEGIYQTIAVEQPQICRMSPESAEVTKLSLNCFVTMKITFANQIGDIADRTPGVNKHDVLKAISHDSRVGPKALLPGYGYGGPCFPRDNRALGGHAKSVGIDPMVMKSVDEYNDYHAQLMAEDRLKQGLDTYVFDNVTFKTRCSVPIIEESQVLRVASLVAKAGKCVIIRDREAVIREVMKEFGSVFEYEIERS